MPGKSVPGFADSARDVAAAHPHADAEQFADLQEKVEVSECQWGDA